MIAGLAKEQKSCLYTGVVQHRRFHPRQHEFSFPLYMIFLDLDEIEDLFRESIFWSMRRFALIRYRREDYHGNPTLTLAAAVRETIARRSGHFVTGPIRMLTHLRYFGYCFNPVTFYYCYDKTDSYVEAILAEVTNTPWKERHAYVLIPKMDFGKDGRHRYELPKVFHVSPFMDMDFCYDWRFSEPGTDLTVFFENLKDDAGEGGSERTKYFDALLILKKQRLSKQTLIKAGLRYPLITLQVMTAIHWHALMLFLKRVPFHRHPRKLVDKQKRSAKMKKSENNS